MKKTIGWTILALSMPAPLWADFTIVISRYKCMTCANLKGHISEFVPVVDAEVVTLRNGTAFLQTVRDSTKLDRFHTISRAVDESLKVMMTLTRRGIKTKLCPFCKRMYKAIKMGAKINRARTTDGDLTVFFVNDPKDKRRVELFLHIGFLFWSDLTENIFWPPFGGRTRVGHTKR